MAESDIAEKVWTNIDNLVGGGLRLLVVAPLRLLAAGLVRAPGLVGGRLLLRLLVALAIFLREEVVQIGHRVCRDEPTNRPLLPTRERGSRRPRAPTNVMRKLLNYRFVFTFSIICNGI